MKPSKQAKKALLDLLEHNSSKSEEELMDDIVQENVLRKHVKKALTKLLRKGEIIEFEGNFSLARVRESSSKPNTDEPRMEEAIPFAEILRRREACATGTIEAPARKEQKEKSIDVDDEIRRLEAELAADSDRSDEEDSADDTFSNEESMQVDVTEGETTSTMCKVEGRVVCLSTLAQDRIAPLPGNCLPKAKKRTLKGIDDQTQQKQQKKQNVNSGLRDAVKEVLSGYVARSHERLPLYCRVCAKQYANEAEFFDHKKTDFHKVAVDIERKASFCKLCRKQFTSPVQLKEHVSSRPHKERLDKLKSRQQSRQGEEGWSKRQWC